MLWFQFSLLLTFLENGGKITQVLEALTPLKSLGSHHSSQDWAGWLNSPPSGFSLVPATATVAFEGVNQQMKKININKYQLTDLTAWPIDSDYIIMEENIAYLLCLTASTLQTKNVWAAHPHPKVLNWSNLVTLLIYLTLFFFLSLWTFLSVKMTLSWRLYCWNKFQR